jgi:hypothetical protein
MMESDDLPEYFKPLLRADCASGLKVTVSDSELLPDVDGLLPVLSVDPVE